MRYKTLIVTYLILISSMIVAQSNEDCFSCHADEEATMLRGEDEISIFVNEDSYVTSIHGSIECIDCHADFEAEELPHREGEDIYKVECSNCHDTESLNESVHHIQNVECFDCHSKHDITEASLIVRDEVKFCIECHQGESTENYIKSRHFINFMTGKEAPTCISCHNSAHEVEDANFSKREIEKICSQCHTSEESNFAKSIHSMAKEEGSPSCIDCHGAHQTYEKKMDVSSQSCLTCHLDKSRFEKINKSKLVEFVENYKISTHAQKLNEGIEAATCADCHGNHIIHGIDETSSLVSRENQPETCGKCHEDIIAEFEISAHGEFLEQGDELAPTCTDCHGEHTIPSVDKSSTNKLATKIKCMSCHVENENIVERIGKGNIEIIRYEESAHYKALLAGNENAATCSDCHGAHCMCPTHQDASWMNRRSEPQTCGQSECHEQISNDYSETIHGVALNQGIDESPTCSDCHGIHQILDHEDPKSKVARGLNVVTLCSDCHEDVKLAEEYNLPVNKPDSYKDSYHGLAIRGGSKYAADCASCHGTHNIRPSSDPLSTIHPDNLSETCGGCHPGADLAKNVSNIHLDISETDAPILFYIKYFYIIMIIVVIGGMLIHNILDVIRKTVDRIRNKEHYAHAKSSGKVYLRMSKNERIQHFIMLTSFILLVVTGFALKYPEFFLFEWSRNLFGEGAFELRSLSHRIFGFAMIAVSLYHTYYLFFNERGKQLLKDFLPKFSDLKEVITNLKWITFISKEKPKFDRFSYMEKAEYWALIWGVIVMGITGLMLTFNDFMLSSFDIIWMDVATIVHLYEAWLATLAIIVWHFYFVIFNPDVFPLNKAFIEGTMTEEQMEHEHPKELERIKGED